MWWRAAQTNRTWRSERTTALNRAQNLRRTSLLPSSAPKGGGGSVSQQCYTAATIIHTHTGVSEFITTQGGTISLVQVAESHSGKLSGFNFIGFQVEKMKNKNWMDLIRCRCCTVSTCPECPPVGEPFLLALAGAGYTGLTPPCLLLTTWWTWNSWTLVVDAVGLSSSCRSGAPLCCFCFISVIAVLLQGSCDVTQSRTNSNWTPDASFRPVTVCHVTGESMYQQRF